MFIGSWSCPPSVKISVALGTTSNVFARLLLIYALSFVPEFCVCVNHGPATDELIYLVDLWRPDLRATGFWPKNFVSCKLIWEELAQILAHKDAAIYRQADHSKEQIIARSISWAKIITQLGRWFMGPQNRLVSPNFNDRNPIMILSQILPYFAMIDYGNVIPA